MTILSNKALNRVYLHGAIQTFAETGGGVFLFVFLLVAGVSVPLVLCTIAAINILRFVLRRWVLPMTRRWGLRNVLIVGTLLESSSYWLVPWVEGPGAMLVLLVIMSSIGSVIYWTCYHAFVAAIGDDDSRGQQVGSMIEALAAAGRGDCASGDEFAADLLRSEICLCDCRADPDGGGDPAHFHAQSAG